MVAGSIFSDAVLEALDYAGIGVTITRFTGDKVVILFVSQRAAEHTGRSPEELLGVDVFELFPDDQMAAMWDQTRAWESGQPAPRRFSTAVLKPSGERVELEFGFARIDFEGEPATISFVLDVTDREHAELALRRSEKRFRRLVEGSPQATAIVRGRLVLFANQAMSMIPNLHVGSPWPDPSPELSQALRDPPPTPVYLTLWTGPPEDSRRFELTLFAVDFDVGPATIVIARDETEKSHMQSQLVSADRLASLGSLASGIAHGVNNPLTTVLLNLSSVRRDLPRLASTEIDLDRTLAKVDQALEAAERVRRSVRHLRGFSSWRKSPADIDVRSVLDAVIDLAAFATSPAVTLVNDYRPVPPVHAEEAGLAHVFLALVRNALQAIPENDAVGQVLIETFVEDGWVVIQVSDSGVGISGDVSRLFEPFYTTGAQHSGLGLTICRTIIEAHGGRISLTSSVDPTTFRVELKPSAEQSDSTGRPPRVLIIEPDVQAAARARRNLRDRHAVRLVGSSQRGLEVALGGGHFDLVVCDATVTEPTIEELRAELAKRRPGLEQRLVRAADPEGLVPPDNTELQTIDKPLRPEVLAELAAIYGGSESSG